MDRILYVDEAGTPGGDPRQPWLVLAGVEVPSNMITAVELYYDQIRRRYLPAESADDSDVEPKGSDLFYHPGQRRSPKSAIDNLPIEIRFEFGRELLAMGHMIPNARYYVSAINTQSSPLPSSLEFGPASVSLKLDKTFRTYLYALWEMVRDFAFRLDRDLSSGIDALMLRPRDRRFIEKGRLIIDESGLNGRIKELETELRRDRDYSVNGTHLFKWRALDSNVDEPWKFVNSKNSKLVQIADILAGIVKLKHTCPSLPTELDRVYFESRLLFQHQSHFYPSENTKRT